MSQLVKQRFLYYKKYKLDIWGVVKNTLQGVIDNTVYKNGNILYKFYKLKKFLFFEKKNFIRIWYNFKNLYKKKKFKKKFILHYIFLTKFIIICNLLKDIYKLPVSIKVQKTIDFFLVKKQQKNKIFFKKPFIYEPRVPFIFLKKFKIKSNIIGIQIMKLFYVLYTFRKLSKIGKKAKKQSGIFEQNFLSIIEAKLPSFLYRTSLFNTLFDSIRFVKQNNVWVNKNYKPFIYYSVKLFDIVGFRVIYKIYIYWNFFKRLRRKAFIFIMPSCFFISFIFFFIVLIRNIRLKDLINTYNFDYNVILSYKK
jgi:hypothetical protein